MCVALFNFANPCVKYQNYRCPLFNISASSSIYDLKYHQSKPTSLWRVTISCGSSQVSWYNTTTKFIITALRNCLNEDISSVQTTAFPSLQICLRFSMSDSVSGSIGDSSKKMTEGFLRSSRQRANFLRFIWDKVDNFTFLNLPELKL